MSAALCFNDWKEPMARPNCTRMLAKSTADLRKSLCTAHHLVGKADRGDVERLLQRAARRTLIAQQLRLDAAKRKPRQFARLIRGFEAPTLQPRGVPAHDKEGKPIRRLGSGRRARTTIRFAECPSRTKLFTPSSLYFPPTRVAVVATPPGVPSPVLFREGEGCDRLAGGNIRQQSPLLLVGAGFQDGSRGQHRRSKIRCAEQRASHFLDRDRQLADAKALASVGLGNVDRGEPEVPAQTAPNLGVAPLVRGHQPTDLARRRPIL